MPDSRPNIVFITCDQLRADALGCYGSRHGATPHLDRLAQDSLVFDEAHVCSPVCAPNRSSWATGLYPSAHGLSVNGIALNEELPTFMECLRRSGYQTAAAGKLHFKPQWSQARGAANFAKEAEVGHGAEDPQPRPWDYPYYGFERCALAEDHSAGPYAEYLRERGFDPWKDPHSATFPQHVTERSSIPVEHSKTNWITDRSLEFMQDFEEDRPFLLWSSYVHPHHPFVAHEPYDTRFSAEDMELPVWDPKVVDAWPEKYRRKYFAENVNHEAVGMHRLSDEDFQRIRAYYYGMVAHLDEQIGRILESPQVKESSRDTVIVFSSDHGEMLGDQHLLFKATHYRCVTRVPLLISSAQGCHARTNALCSAVDLMPTLLDLAGVAHPAGLQGKTLEPLLSNPEMPLRDGLYIENPDVVRSYVTHEARISWHGAGEPGELYDLTTDPNELDNLWDQGHASDLKARLQAELMDALILESPIPHTRVANF